MLDYGESAMISLAITNVGTEDASDVNVMFSTTNEYVTVTDSEENYGTILAGETIMVDDAFGVQLANDIPDGQGIIFNVESTGDATWNSTFSEMGHAPVLMFGEYTIDDAAGEALDKGGKLMGIPYPGGPLIEKEALEGDSAAYQFPRALLKDAPLDLR